MKNVFFAFLLMSCFFSFLQLQASDSNQQPDSVYTLRGRVLGSDSREPLVNAGVTLENTNVASITNQDGYFTIRIRAAAKNSQLLIRHLGYENRQIPVVTLINAPNNHILMTPSSIRLQEVEVVSGDGAELMREALRRIPENYASEPNMMVAFYRESIKKGSNYISLVEAVLDIYKASYRSFSNDQAKIYIGRKATDIAARDTILLKFQGGISDALFVDIAKNPEVVFGNEGEEYIFNIEGMININNKPHYNIAFIPHGAVKDILFRGNVYLDAQSLAFARMEFSMNVEKRKDAAAIFIKRKPSKMRVEVERAKYIVNYLEKNGKWYFNYSSTDVAFKVRWTNRFFGLFSTTYTIGS